MPRQQIQSTQNVSKYTVFPFADLEGYNDMTPTLGTCFANTGGLSINNTLFGLVDACTQKNEECCYDAANVGDQCLQQVLSQCIHRLANNTIDMYSCVYIVAFIQCLRWLVNSLSTILEYSLWAELCSMCMMLHTKRQVSHDTMHGCRKAHCQAD